MKHGDEHTAAERDDSLHDSRAARSPELVAVPHAHGSRGRRALIEIKAEGKSLEAITKPITSTQEPATAGV